MLDFKKYPNITLAIAGALALLMIISLIFALSSGKKLTAAYKLIKETPTVNQIPLILIEKKTYGLGDYEKFKSLLNKNKEIESSIRQNGIILQTRLIQNEEKWMHLISEVLASDNNLIIKQICGSVNNECENGSFFAEIVGETKIAKLKESQI